MPRRASAQPEPMLAPALMSVGGSPSLMAATGPVALTVYQGDDKRWLFKLKQNSTTPFPLDGYTAALQFRVMVADDAAMAVPPDVPLSPEVVVTDAPGGEITVTLLSELSQQMRATEYLWDLEITKTGATTAEDWTTTVAAGTLTVTKEVTRLS